MGKRGQIVVNGRFATRPLTGVDRVAAETVRAIIDIIKDKGINLGIDIICPKSESINFNDLVPEVGLLRGHVWEQFELPIRSSGRLIYSACNVGPALYSQQMLVVHDAQVYTNPGAYSRAFRAWYKLILPIVARRAKIIVTVSDHSLNELEKYNVFPRGKGRVVYNGADHILRVNEDCGALEKFGLTEGAYFLALGTLSPHKNLSILMQAARERSLQSAPIVIAGGGNPKVFADAGLSPPDNVRLLGRVSDEELKALYKGALAFVFPSKAEGFGLPPLEAMLCGCPVIASSAGAIPEVCGSASVYVAPQDLPGWISAMDQMESDASLRARMRMLGYQRARNFTWRKTAEAMLSLVKEFYPAGEEI